MGLDDLVSKGKHVLESHEDQAADALDKAADALDKAADAVKEHTDDKTDSVVDTVVEKAKELLGEENG
jgi:hypothetical protein